jgi:hypothetical protein
MALLSLTVNNLSPALEHKSGEAQVIARALEEAARMIQSNQALVTSGNIVLGSYGTVGSWTLVNQASLP